MSESQSPIDALLFHVAVVEILACFEGPYQMLFEYPGKSHHMAPKHPTLLKFIKEIEQSTSQT